jgi:WD40 repeat protein
VPGGIILSVCGTWRRDKRRVIRSVSRLYNYVMMIDLKERQTSDKVALDLDQMTGANLLVTGSTDRTVSFWDFRQGKLLLLLLGHLGLP